MAKPVLLAALLLCACASGGWETGPISDVAFTDSRRGFSEE